MLIELCVLASGSSGNCSMLRTPAGVVLIDAGLQPRTAAKRMDGTGVMLSDVLAICVTHLDRDHFSSAWAKWAMEHRRPIYCHRDRAEQCIAYVTRDFELEPAGVERFRQCLQSFDETCFEPLPGLRFAAIHLPHDQEGSHGFVVEGFGCRLGYATDFGHVPRELFDHFDDLNLLAIESNYDPAMQVESSRPAFQKQRIMGGAGHLSNEQAFEAVRAILDRSAQRGNAHAVAYCAASPKPPVQFQQARTGDFFARPADHPATGARRAVSAIRMAPSRPGTAGPRGAASACVRLTNIFMICVYIWGRVFQERIDACLRKWTS